VQDNAATYYNLGSASSLSDCQAKCLATSECQGIEFNDGIKRCEVWTRPIESSAAAAGFDCYVHHASPGATTEPATSTDVPSSGSFQLVEGGGRACRGANVQDNAATYYNLGSASSLSDCQAKCLATTECQGIEFNDGIKRCEVWTRPIESSEAAAGFDCYTFRVPTTETVQPSTTTSTSIPAMPTICYGELQGVAAEEGNGVGEIKTLSLQECRQACSQNELCKSAAFCPEFEGCYLKDKPIFSENERTQKFYDCQTTYQKPCG